MSRWKPRRRPSSRQSSDQPGQGALLGTCAAASLLGHQWSYDGPELSIAAVLTLYVLDAALVVMCALLALYLRYRSVSDIRTGVLWIGLGLVAGGLMSLAPAITFASSTGYSNQRSVVGAEVVIVAACCRIGIAAGALAWLSTRRVST